MQKERRKWKEGREEGGEKEKNSKQARRKGEKEFLQNCTRNCNLKISSRFSNAHISRDNGTTKTCSLN